ncbi:hypothetical protein [Xanthomonas cassavae]|uniref:hypothetical protein n=1 Tax=Xanthomonas cassavae TaxID=56450 RepID=UPI000492DDE7
MFAFVHDRLRVVEQAQPEAADRKAHRQVAERRAQAQPSEQRDGNHRRAQQAHHVDQVTGVGSLAHARILTTPLHHRPASACLIAVDLRIGRPCPIRAQNNERRRKASFAKPQ